MKALSRGLLLSAIVLVMGLGCGGEKPPIEEHSPPEIIVAFQSDTTVAVGGTVTLRLEVQDVPDAALEFGWKPGNGKLGAPTRLDSSREEIVWKAPICVSADTSMDIQASVTNAWKLSAHKIFTVTVLKGCPEWLGTGKMATPRARHSATVLPSGRVLVAGGTDGQTQLASAELYDPATGLWTPTASMSTERIAHTATLLPSGKVLSAGGSRLDVALDTAELYDPQTGLWAPTGTMSSPRRDHTATLLPSGKVLVTGGWGSSGEVASAELYDPATGAWAPTGAMVKPRMNHAASLLLTGQVLVTGGYVAQAVTTQVELYNPQTGTWRAATPLAIARAEHSASVLPSGKVLITGGNGTGSEKAELFDPTKGWTSAGAMQMRRRYHAASVLPSGKVLVTGGNGSEGFVDTAEMFEVDPVFQTTGLVTNRSSAPTRGRGADSHEEDDEAAIRQRVQGEGGARSGA